jgi:hypothetical protein
MLLCDFYESDLQKITFEYPLKFQLRKSFYSKQFHLFSLPQDPEVTSAGGFVGLERGFGP